MFFFQVAFLELVMPYTNNNVIYPLKRYLAKKTLIILISDILFTAYAFMILDGSGAVQSYKNLKEQNKTFLLKRYHSILCILQHPPVYYIRVCLFLQMKHLFFFCPSLPQTLKNKLEELEASIQEMTQNFDKTVCKLFERKVNLEKVIYQVWQRT